MLLVREKINHVRFLTERDDEGTKRLYIQGIFLQGDLKNHNGRIYPSVVLDSAVDVYRRTMIETKRSIGELNHPETPSLDYERACIKTVSLTKDGSNYIGKAQVLTTPLGNLVRSLIEDDVQLAVSSRGLASIEEENGAEVIQPDFLICAAADVVHDPSAPDAFVEGVMENRQWVMESGVWKPELIESSQRRIRSASSRDLPDTMKSVFSRMMREAFSHK